MDLTDKQIRDSLLNKVALIKSQQKALEEQLKKVQTALEVYSPKSTDSKNGAEMIHTFKSKIQTIFNESERFLTSNEVKDRVNIRFPNKIYSQAKFSGQFSITYQKLGIKRFEEKDNPITTRFYYGLKDWFDKNGDPKPEYKKNDEELETLD